MIAGAADAQIRMWVSGVGADTNPCTRTAPCKAFDGALAAVPAGRRATSRSTRLARAILKSTFLNRAVTIDGGGTFAGILLGGISGITIFAGASDVVTIRNLSLNGRF